MLLRNAGDLETDQRKQLRALLDVNEPLRMAYTLQDQLKKIWSYQREGWAERALLQWAALAYDSGLQPLIRSTSNSKSKRLFSRDRN